MGRELRDAIVTVVKWLDNNTLWTVQRPPRVREGDIPAEVLYAAGILRQAVSGWVPGEREEA